MLETELRTLMERAFESHSAGRLDEACSIYRRVLSEFPNQPSALHLLGAAAIQLGDPKQGEELIQKALPALINDPGVHNNLGNALRNQGKIPEAEKHFRKAIELFPRFAMAHNNLGLALLDQNLVHQAIDCFTRSINIAPDYPDAQFHLGAAFARIGEKKQALAAYNKALNLNPQLTEAWNNLGLLMLENHQGEHAIECFKKAVVLCPDSSLFLTNLGIAYKSMGQLDKALKTQQAALKISPDDPAILNNLGNVLYNSGDPQQAGDCYLRALKINPDYGDVHSNYAAALKSLGQLDEAVNHYSQSLALNPNNPQNYSNLILTLYYQPPGDASELLTRLLAQFNRKFGGAQTGATPSPNQRSASSRIRIGFVSPDFHTHPVGQNLLPLFQSIDRSRFDLCLYSNSSVSDSLTERFTQLASVYRNILDLSDDAAERLIREDGIDVLIDLALHTAGNRLPLMARKPARFCLSWAGYPGTTGLSAIDYALSDPFIGRYDSPTLFLPKTFWCYDPLALEIPVSSLPAIDNGFVTFGSLHNFCKINPTLLNLWKQILCAVPNFRLLMQAPTGPARDHVIHALEVDPSRIVFMPRCPRKEYLLLHHKIDLMLDAFPYTGHTSSLDAFWMGVPVVSRVGTSPVSRGGWSLLNNLGHPELAAFNDADYVSLAVRLANDIPQLQSLRSNLRQSMRQSPLMDGKTFANDFSALLLNLLQ